MVPARPRKAVSGVNTAVVSVALAIGVAAFSYAATYANGISLKRHRFVAALGGTLKLIADFGDEQLKIA
jgi:hypothetical protein